MTSVKGRYSKIDISLNKPETEKELYLTGDYLSVVSITGDATCEIKIDHRHSQAINLREVSEISGAFSKIYLTTNGDGGTCSVFVGDGLSMHVVPDPQKRRNPGIASTQVLTSTTIVQALANNSYVLNNVSLLNSSGVYSCFVGPYNSDAATFRTHAYVLLPHKTLHFSIADMAALAVISYDNTHNIILDVIGTYE